MSTLTLAFIASWSRHFDGFWLVASQSWLELSDNAAECLLAGRTTWLRIYRSFPTMVGGLVPSGSTSAERNAPRVQSSTCVPCAIPQGRVTSVTRPVFLTGCRLGWRRKRRYLYSIPILLLSCRHLIWINARVCLNSEYNIKDIHSYQMQN